MNRSMKSEATKVGRESRPPRHSNSLVQIPVATGLALRVGSSMTSLSDADKHSTKSCESHKLVRPTHTRHASHQASRLLPPDGGVLSRSTFHASQPGERSSFGFMKPLLSSRVRPERPPEAPTTLKPEIRVTPHRGLLKAECRLTQHKDPHRAAESRVTPHRDSHKPDSRVTPHREPQARLAPRRDSQRSEAHRSDLLGKADPSRGEARTDAQKVVQHKGDPPRAMRGGLLSKFKPQPQTDPARFANPTASTRARPTTRSIATAKVAAAAKPKAASLHSSMISSRLSNLELAGRTFERRPAVKVEAPTAFYQSARTRPGPRELTRRVPNASPLVSSGQRLNRERRPKRPSIGDGWNKRAQYLLDMTVRRKTSILESSPSIPSSRGSPRDISENDDMSPIDSSPILVKKKIDSVTPVPFPAITVQPPGKTDGPKAPAPTTSTVVRSKPKRDSLSQITKSPEEMKKIQGMVQSIVKNDKQSPVPFPSPSLLLLSKPNQCDSNEWKTPATRGLPSPVIRFSLRTPPFNGPSSVMLSCDPKAPIRKPISTRVLLSGILCQSPSTIESAISELGEDPNGVLGIPMRYRYRFHSPPSAPPCERASALLIAAKVSSPGVVSKLLELGAVVNTVDDQDRNALHTIFVPTPAEYRQSLPHAKPKVSLPVPPHPKAPSVSESRRASLVTPRVVCHSVEPSGWGQVADIICGQAFPDAEHASRIIELLCLQGCSLERRDIFGCTPVDYAKQWLTVFSHTSKPACLARAAALTLIAFEDRIRLRLLAPLTTNLSIKAFKPFKCIEIAVPPKQDGDLILFTPHGFRCEHSERAVSGRHISTRYNCDSTAGKNGSKRRSTATRLPHSGKQRSRTAPKTQAPFDLKQFVDLVKHQSYAHPSMLGIWEYLGANFRTEHVDA
eukprot:Blabericola_migrator_1__9826@NODE_53_length_16193_cov_63_357497_g49_i0_p2_GENE_NODE_53_length_16193_cov_63_357497_g49_i0NODE_53_length_16193_cov_63_357497_g49_i0_p2_ORF_typecomplete_len905_score107_69Ank_5/PF13857_6/0_00022Ank_5/PF13857_6/1_6Ank_4/PF13637_6/0_009Ank_4/PF13637_6/8_4Ank_2/PF12796_7/0_046Ank_2/PF12796_7/54_NODE_53_length_16193_cov_63_357497_g49_i01217214886